MHAAIHRFNSNRHDREGYNAESLDLRNTSFGQYTAVGLFSTITKSRYLTNLDMSAVEKRPTSQDRVRPTNHFKDANFSQNVPLARRHLCNIGSHLPVLLFRHSASNLMFNAHLPFQESLLTTRHGAVSLMF